MKNIAIICFSLTGWQTGEKLKKGLCREGYTVSLDGKSKYLPESMEISVGEWTGKRFLDSDGIIFVGACGIAVRHIAPYIVGKKTDPAVLVVDECGTYAISLLSGHLGGANALAQTAAGILEGTAVITTATDLHKRFAVDVFARKNDCSIFHMKAAKNVSAALLAGENVGFYSEFPWEGELPEGLVLCDREGNPAEGLVLYDWKGNPAEGLVLFDREINHTGGKGLKRPAVGIAVTIHKNCCPFDETVHVVPRVVVMGMGCRKGKEAKAVCALAVDCLKKKEIYQEAAACLASIDIKKEEPGLLALSQQWNVPFCTYSGEELKGVPGDFTPSTFVKEVTGVDNVCERSAVLASGNGTLMINKQAADGVTAAAAVKNWRIRFE